MKASADGRSGCLGDGQEPARAQSLVAEDLLRVIRKHRIVDGVSLEVAPGSIVGLLGPNGAGKTTTFSMIVGLTDPDHGDIRLGSKSLIGLPLHRRALEGIAYLPQEASIFRRLTVSGNLQLVLEALACDEDQIQDETHRLLDEFGLEGVADRPGYLLSGGERRRCEIARAMALRPRHLLLDEPFAGIDPIAVAEIQRIVRRLSSEGIGVLITDHNVRETLQITDRAYIINRGKIFRSGSPAELAEDPEVRAVYLGEDFRLE
ncbi:MAG TPA: LPS export ABC transporter ATP-binding protein [Acidobacteria bacterium]|nr:LPS export ABC transporter ATP-binding protein [Acidobacteriota bacterium]